jgi:F0F1-type ATP synthase membrane subunit c/vacuolar-type H+-ATPase subunit K
MNTLKIYARQPSTWLGLAKLGAALGLYSTGVGGAIGTAVMGVFGLLDVLRNERVQPVAK